MIWIVGQYSDRIENANELLEQFLESFRDDATDVQLALLTAIVKLFIKRPSAGQDLIPRVLKWATEEAENPDLRDRGYIYWRLLSTNPVAAKTVVLNYDDPEEEAVAETPVPSQVVPGLDLLELGTANQTVTEVGLTTNGQDLLAGVLTQAAPVPEPPVPPVGASPFVGAGKALLDLLSQGTPAQPNTAPGFAPMEPPTLDPARILATNAPVLDPFASTKLSTPAPAQPAQQGLNPFSLNFSFYLSDTSAER
ncbi:hypothetical protein HDU96_004083 [Phlyctochytrium bullatum]|nr:hypothetical protein HDU96_004083 [Phlyctochytrium bullatum]